ncbi:MAG: nucleotidyltransferase domain-containing protein [Actinomycetota bacterium]|nr:nucleotidyltransferase domain-containing protein [Actinomycetota bacterium]
MFKREKDILRKIVKELSKDSRVIKVVAFGSRVRGDFRGDSDLDIMVIVNKKTKDIRDKVLDLFYSYELETDISFSVAILSVEELKINEKLGSPFIKSVEEEGMVLYGT